MLATLRQRTFALLWVAGLISFVGDWLLIATLPVHVYERTGSTLAAGLIWLTYPLSGRVFGSVAGVFVDRWDYSAKRPQPLFSMKSFLVTPHLRLPHAPLAWR